MCELLVVVKDRGLSGDYDVDCHAAKAGDVGTIINDGANWGTGPLGVLIEGDPNGNRPWFRILKCPNIEMRWASFLLSPETLTGPNDNNPYLQYRQFYIDLTKITDQALLDYMADDARASPWIMLNYDYDWLQSVTSKRPKLTGP